MASNSTIETKGILIGFVAPAEIEALLREVGFVATAYRDASAEHVHMRVENSRGRFVGGLWVRGPTSSMQVHSDLYGGPRTLIAGSSPLEGCIRSVVSTYGGFFLPPVAGAVPEFDPGCRPEGLSPRDRLWLQLRRTIGSTEAMQLVDAAFQDPEYAKKLADGFAAAERQPGGDGDAIGF